MQVSGELSNDGQPMRRFMQTFVLAPGEVSTNTFTMQSINEYVCSKYVHVTVVLILYIWLFRLITIFKRPPSWFQQGKVEIGVVTRVISWGSTFSINLPMSSLLSHKSLKTNGWCILFV